MATLQTLKTSKDFQAAKNGKFLRSSSFLLQALKVTTGRVYQDGIIQVGAHDGVVRNRIKRRLRQIVADVIHDYGKNSWNYVLIGKKNIITEDFEVLKKEFKTALTKIHK